MAFSHGKVGVFSIDDNGGTLRNISAYVTNVDFSRDVDTPETTTFGDSDREFIVGLRGATFSISGHWDNTATTGPDDVLNGVLGGSTALAFEFGPEGSTAGDVKYSGNCYETSYSVTTPVDGVVDFSADFIVTGAVARGSY